MTRTFKTPEELMIALIQGDKWTTSHITGVCSFDKDKVPDFNPFRCKTVKTDFAISARLYTHCDGKTLWTKVEDKPKKKISLAMFTCQNIKNKEWVRPVIAETLDTYEIEWNDTIYTNHHEIPKTRYEQEIDDA